MHITKPNSFTGRNCESGFAQVLPRQREVALDGAAGAALHPSQRFHGRPPFAAFDAVRRLADRRSCLSGPPVIPRPAGPAVDELRSAKGESQRRFFSQRMLLGDAT